MSKHTGLVIIGAGGHGRVAGEIAELTGRYSEILYLDDATDKTECLGHPIVGKIKDWVTYKSNHDYFVAIGNNEFRQQVTENLTGLDIATLVHPAAIVSRYATVGAGSIIMANTCVSTDASLGLGCIVDAGTVVGHESILGNFVHTGIFVGIDANCTIADSSFISPGTLIPRGTAL